MRIKLTALQNRWRSPDGGRRDARHTFNDQRASSDLLITMGPVIKMFF